MDSFASKTFTTSRSLTYTYYDSAPTTPSSTTKPPLLLLHGFPDNAHLWQNVIPHLLPLGHRILAPDLLGHGKTSKPTDPTLFASNAMSTDLAELLAHERVPRAVVVGHDWGSYLAQRLWLWHPTLVAGLALLNVAYMPPASAPFDLPAANARSEQATRFPRYAYWELFTAADGAHVVDAHLEAFWGVLHGAREHWMRDMFCVRDGMRTFLVEDGAVELREYAQPGQGWKEGWFRAVVEGGGLASALCWYRAMVGNVQYEAEKALPEGRVVVTVPAFFLACTGDDVCLPELIEPSRAAGLLPDLEVETIEAAHWCTMEKPDEVGKALYGFLSKRF